ncbi:MAG: hypothetical protein PHW69_05660, partial [Elusimicrobiaceae bacterium]|nr:hypothetical protein [Elusimicrobiaceae bacterium]
DYADSGEDARARAELDKMQARLDSLAERQSGALSVTQGVAEAQAGRRAQVQRDMVSVLSDRQLRLALRAESCGGYIGPEIPAAMRALAGEIRALKIGAALTIFGGVKNGLYAVSVTTPAVAEELLSIRAEQDAVGAELEKLSDPPVPPSDSEKQQLGLDGAQQRAILSETEELARSARRFAEEDGLPIPPELAGRLDAASAEMRAAGERLAAFDSTAAGSQARALKLLEDGRDRLERTRREMSSRSAGYQSSGRKREGAQGRESAGRARLPSSEDYLPPAAIREKAMQSMREDYPRARGELIREYLRRLAQ